MAGDDLVNQLGLDGGVVDRIGGVRGRDCVSRHKRAAADGLIGAGVAAGVGDVGVVFGHPIDVGAVEDLLVKGRDAGGCGVVDL